MTVRNVHVTIAALVLACLAAQPAMADMVNLICQHAPASIADDPVLFLIWVDAGANKVYVAEADGFQGKGALVEDAVARANRGELKEFEAIITPTSIKWTQSTGMPQPIAVDRLTGELTWTNTDPNLPGGGTAQCKKGDVPFPTAKF